MTSREWKAYRALLKWLETEIPAPVLEELQGIEDRMGLPGSVSLMDITIAVLNLPVRMPDEALSVNSVRNINWFVRAVRPLLPTMKFNNYKFVELAYGNDPDANMIDAITRMHRWLYDFRIALENALTKRYLVGGRMKYLEVLKRRFRATWTDKEPSEITVQQETPDAANTGKLTVTIVDAQ